MPCSERRTRSSLGLDSEERHPICTARFAQNQFLNQAAWCLIPSHSDCTPRWPGSSSPAGHTSFIVRLMVVGCSIGNTRCPSVGRGPVCGLGVEVRSLGHPPDALRGHYCTCVIEFDFDDYSE